MDQRLCDHCRNVLNPGIHWTLMSPEEIRTFGELQEYHFCSVACLASWSESREG